MALAGMVAAFGAGAWFVTERAPEAIAHVSTEAAKTVKNESIKAIMTRKGLSVAEQEALMGRMKAQYPKVAKTIDGWTPVTAEKLEALNTAYQSLSPAERQAIATDVSAWQQQVWKKYPAVREAWSAGGAGRETRVAENILELAATDRAQLDTSVSGLWSRISARNPGWAAQVDSILSAK
jgi:hypothetical protein